MSKTTPTTTDPKISAIIDFFENNIEYEQMAQQIRRLNYILTLTIIRNDENKNPIDLDWIDSSFFWLNEFAEIIDPSLTK